MKLLFMIGIIGNGGAERVIANLSKQFAHDGHEVYITTIYSNRRDYDIDSNVRTFSANNESQSQSIRVIKRVFSIRKLVKQINPEVIISFLSDVNMYVIVSLWGLKYKIVISERNDPGNDPPQKWMRRIRNLLYAKANGIVFQTEDAEKYFDGILPATIHRAVISNPLFSDLPLYNPAVPCRHFIAASRLCKQKNLPMAIEAMRLLVPDYPDCTLSIFGDGPEKDHLQELINTYNLNDHVSLEGFKPNIYAYMQKACALIISSDYEGMSNSMLEALGIGLPVIATDCPVGGARMFIENGMNGYLIECGNSTSLANAMKAILTDHTMASRFEENARAIRERLSITSIAQQWYDFLKH